MTIQLNIGSNLADRYAQIEQAVGMLTIAFRREAACKGYGADSVKVARSQMMESEPWGYESDNAFVNIGIRIDLPFTLAPEAVLEITRGVEQIVSYPHPVSHRNAQGLYCDRLIDIDIIDIDHIHFSSPALTLPHPHAADRPFVARAMAELSNLS